MASILDRYGIKEVADVTMYEINPDGTPGYLLVNGEKYTYIDYKYATEVKHIRFSRYDSPIIKLKVEKYKPTSERIFNKIFN